jgi:dTDP-glucose 4,6-dehydratase
LLRRVADRPGHDRRYSLDTSKMQALGWSPVTSFDDGIRATVDWYRDNRAWWEPIKSGEFRAYYERQYGERLSTSSPA